MRVREITAARHHVLVEQAESLFDTDRRRAEALLKQALELAPGRDTAYKLLETLQERGRRQDISEVNSRIRELETTHDFNGALLLAEQALAENAGDPELVQTAARLRQRVDRAIQPAESPTPQPSHALEIAPARAFLHAAWEKASALASRPRANSGLARERSLAPSSVRDESAGEGVASAEKTPSNAGTPSTVPSEREPAFARISRLRALASISWLPHSSAALVAIAGSIVAVAILFALVVARLHPHAANVPHATPVIRRTTAAPPRTPTPASLPIHLAPPDAQVFVDGSPASLSNGTLIVKPGMHVVEVRSPGYKPFSRSVQISASNNEVLDVALVPVPVPPAIYVETDLQSGTVLVDGKHAGTLEGGQFTQEAPGGSHTITIVTAGHDRYSFAFTLGGDSVWTLGVPRSSGYGTPVLAALASNGARIVCGRPGLAFVVDGGRPVACTTVGANLPPLSEGNHRLTLLEGSRKVAVHSLNYQASPLLTAFISTGAQFGGLMIQGTEDTFDVSVNGYPSKRPATEGRWRRLLRPGTYSVAVNKPGFAANPSAVSVSITPGVDTTEQVSFTPVPVSAHLRLQSQPGTEVAVNGKFAGMVPQSGILDLSQLPAGPAELQLQHKGFAEARQTVTLVKGENQRTILLQELKAKITWTVDPPNAQLSYSTPGIPVRHALSGNATELPAGIYEFEASAPGRVPASSVVTVNAGETKAFSLRLNAVSPAILTIASWPGWDPQAGWLVRDKPGPIFQTLPERASLISFQAQWERPKTLVHWFGGSLNLVFRTSDGMRSVTFRIAEHGISWSSIVGGERQEGKFALNLGKNSENIEADIRPSGIALTVNGSPLSAVGANLYSEPKLQFGFIIEQDQIVRLSSIRVATQSN